MTSAGKDSDRKINIPQPIRSDGTGGLDKGPRDIMRDLDELVQSNLNVGPELMSALRKVKWPVVKYPKP